MTVRFLMLVGFGYLKKPRRRHRCRRALNGCHRPPLRQ
jgi:hypothetical protein